MKNSLYFLIKEQYSKKNRPLKIVCDWDEVIQPINPLIWYKLAKEKGWNLEKEDFKKWFDYYWTNAKVEYHENCPWTKYTSIEEVEKIRERGNKEEFKKLVWDPLFEIMNSPDYYEKAPFLTCAEDLLKALDEGLIERLSFITTTRGVDHRKQKIFDKVFKNRGKANEITLFPQGHYRLTGERRIDTEKHKEPFWKQPVFYYGLASGVAIVLLGFGIFWLIKTKKKT